MSIVLVDVSERVATITLNRPEARNALSSEVLHRVPEVVRELEADDAVDVMILTGADPAFCAGLDLKELGSSGANLGASGSDHRGPFPPRTKPLIGAVNGVAVTGGLEYALACDFLLASERARFADTHARVGVMPGWGLTVLLPQAVGVRRARQMSLTGDYLDAATALSWGLVNEVVAHDRLLDRAREVAAAIVSNDQPGVRRMLATYEETAATTVADGWRAEAEAARSWTISTDEVARRRAAIQERGRAQTGSG